MSDDTRSTNRPFVVLAAVSSHAADMAEQGRFPDGSYSRWCVKCDVGSPEQEWRDDRCPDCGARSDP